MSTYKKTKTYQAQLTKDQIIEKLDGYVKVDNIMDVELDTHVRYFENKNGKAMFRLGGFVKSIANDFVYLSNGKNNWRTPTADTIFFRKEKSSNVKLVTKSNTKSNTKSSTKSNTKSKDVELEHLSTDNDNIQEKYEKKMKEKDKIIEKLQMYIKDLKADIDYYKNIQKKLNK